METRRRQQQQKQQQQQRRKQQRGCQGNPFSTFSPPTPFSHFSMRRYFYQLERKYLVASLSFSTSSFCRRRRRRRHPVVDGDTTIVVITTRLSWQQRQQRQRHFFGSPWFSPMEDLDNGKGGGRGGRGRGWICFLGDNGRDSWRSGFYGNATKEDGNDDVIINNTLYAKKNNTSNNNNNNNIPLSIMQCSINIHLILKCFI